MNQQFHGAALLGRILLALISSVWLAVAPGHAADLEASNPPFQETGRIHNVNQDQVVLDDRGYVLSPNIIIHSGNKTVSKMALMKGTNIGFNSIVETSGLYRSVITEIWILPSR